MITRVALVILAGCGRIGFDVTSDGATADTQITGRHWVNLNDSMPGPLISPRAAWMPGGIVMYGGASGPGNPPTQVSAVMWQYGPSGWTMLCSPCTPGPRVGEGLAYDSHRDRLVLFGGWDDTQTVRGDLWEWDGATWTPITPTGTAPTARALVTMVFDNDRNVVVLIGGVLSSFVAAADVYEYDGVAWTHPPPLLGPIEVACGGQCGTYDPIQRRVLVSDEDTANDLPSDQLWGWDGSAWTEACSACTGTARTAASLIYDPETRSDYMIDGFIPGTGGIPIQGTLQVTAATPWPRISSLPGARDSSAVAYDATTNLILLYGGNGESCGGDCNETWQFVPD